MTTNVHIISDSPGTASLSYATDDRDNLKITGDLEVADVYVLNDARINNNLSMAGSAGQDSTITIITALQAGGGGGIGLQYKNRSLTFTKGVLTTVGAESGWNDL